MASSKQNLQKLIRRMPKFMRPEVDRIETISDLEFQIRHEIDLATEPGSGVIWTRAQMHKAKMYWSDVRIALLEHAEQFDELNDAV